MSVEAEVFERTFAVEEAGELILSNISGDVEIRSWDYPEIKVSGRKRPGGFLPWVSPEEGFHSTRVEMEQTGSRVVVRTTRLHEGFWGFVNWLGGVARVDYTVRVPRRCSVVVDLVAGRLSVDDVRGSVIARTVSAGATLQHLRGSLAASTVSGGIVAEDVSGKAALRTVSGEIRATRCRFEALSGQTVSGRIEVETPLAAEGSYEFQSVSGNVVLALPPGTRCTADLQSLSGSIRSSLPGEVREASRGHWRAEINGGGPRVRVKSVSGGLRLVEPEALGALPERAATPVAPEPEAPAAPAPEAPPTPPAAGEATSRESIMMMILAAVERGELSVEEAAAKLAELDSLTGEAGGPAQAEPRAADGQ